MRLVEAEGRKIGVFHFRAASSTRSRIAARTTTARSPRVSSTPASCTVECPRHGSLFDLRTGKPKSLPAYQTGRHLRRPCRSRRSEIGALRIEMTPTRDSDSADDCVRQAADRGRVRPQGHRLRLQGEVRLLRSRDRLRLQGPQGPQPRADRVDLRVQVRAAVDARLPPQGLRALREPPDPAMGRRPQPDRLRGHPLLRPRLREEASAAGTRSPRTSRTRSTSSASPRRSASSSPASGLSTRASRSTTRSTRSSRPRA